MPPPEPHQITAAIFATGQALDDIAHSMFGVHRQLAETDNQLRDRIRAQRGTLAGRPAGLTVDQARAQAMASRSYGGVMPAVGSYAAARVQADMESALRRDALMRGMVVPQTFPEVEYIPPARLATEYARFLGEIQPPKPPPPPRTAWARILEDGED